MNIPKDIRALKGMLDDLSFEFDQLNLKRKKILAARGWKETCNTPGSVWLWEKKLDDGRVILMTFDSAWCNESTDIEVEAAEAMESEEEGT